MTPNYTDAALPRTSIEGVGPERLYGRLAAGLASGVSDELQHFQLCETLHRLRQGGVYGFARMCPDGITVWNTCGIPCACGLSGCDSGQVEVERFADSQALSERGR